MLDVPVDCAILVTNRYGSELEGLCKAIAEESNFKGLKSIGLKHLPPDRISQLKGFGRPRTGAAAT
jgi:hypothetical protein